MRRRDLAGRLVGRWLTLPPRTIRTRLTAVYGSLFLLCGAALLAINYGLVSSQYTTGYFLSVSQKAGHVVQGRVRHAGEHAFSSGTGGHVGRIVHVNGAGAGGPTLASNEHVVPSGFKSPSPAALLASARASSHAAVGTLLIESGVALAIMALLSAGLGWLVAGRALRPLRAITATAREISASNLHRRLALAGPDDELHELGSTFDALLERLETAFATQRQFAANVSHELRTPLTLERTLIEVALADHNASNERLRAVLTQVLAAGEDQERLIEALLLLSRSQRGLETREPIDLAAVAAQTLGSIDARDLTVERSLEQAQTDGDPRLIDRLLANLLTNAVEHNRPGGRIELATRTADGHAIIHVTNTGPVIAAADHQRLFEPFQRLDGSRASRADGLGLGLSIVKAIADTHGATITTSLPDRGGLSIQVVFASRNSPVRARAAADGTPDADRDTARVIGVAERAGLGVGVDQAAEPHGHGTGHAASVSGERSRG